MKLYTYCVNVFLVMFLPSLLLIFGFQSICADVFVPKDEFLSYFDANNIYTVVGAVKNTENYPVIPTIHLTVSQNDKKITFTQDLPAVSTNKDIPFKIKLQKVNDTSAILETPWIEFKRTGDVLSDLEVVYDKSLIRHSDGHLTGKIINNGNQTKYNIKVYATVHGDNNKFIDVVQNQEKINKIDPGEIAEFTMYPEPVLAKNVNYYSCFALGDETIIPLSTIRNGEKFDFRYDSTAWFIVKGFDETGTKLFLSGTNSFKFPAYVNFEFPRTSENEKFEVMVNEKPIKFLQSKDEDGNWHVAFDVSGSTQYDVLISGFETSKKQKTDSASNVLIPDYSYLYYLIPVVILIGFGMYAYKRKKAKSIT